MGRFVSKIQIGISCPVSRPSQNQRMEFPGFLSPFLFISLISKFQKILFDFENLTTNSDVFNLL